MRVLLIEDDPTFGGGLRTGLEQEGHTVDWLTDGNIASRAFATDSFEVVILDLALPRRTGMDLLAEWRAAGNAVPVLILTAFDDIDDRVRGLDTGADDYLVKPVDIEELSARLRAVVRRRRGDCNNRLQYGPLSLDRTTGCVLWHDEPVQLSQSELALLEALLERPGATISRRHLESRLYGGDDGPESNCLEVHIHNLRHKLTRNFIATERGLGYRVQAGAA